MNRFCLIMVLFFSLNIALADGKPSPSCKEGQTEAQCVNHLNSLLFQDKLVPVVDQTFAELKDFCPKIKDACYKIGQWHRERSDIESATKMFRLSCSSEMPSACINLAEALIQQKKVSEAVNLMDTHCPPKDYGKQHCIQAAGLYEFIGHSDKVKAMESGVCNAGYLDSCLRVINVEIRKGRFSVAKRKAKLLCDNKLLSGCAMYVQALEIMGENDKALKIVKPYCDAGIMSMCDSYVYILTKKGDVTKANEMNQKFCDQGIFSYCMNLAYNYKSAEKFDDALRVFAPICEKGVKDACQQIDDINSQMKTKS